MQFAARVAASLRSKPMGESSLRPLKNYDTLAMVVVFGTKTNLALEYTLFFRESSL